MVPDALIRVMRSGTVRSRAVHVAAVDHRARAIANQQPSRPLSGATAELQAKGATSNPLRQISRRQRGSSVFTLLSGPDRWLHCWPMQVRV